jgi:hypothetical protein
MTLRESTPSVKETAMLNKIVMLALAAVLAALLVPSDAGAWGAARVSGVRVGPGGGVYAGSRTVAAGPGGVYAGGRTVGVGGYGGGVYRGGYAGGVGYGGAAAGGYRYNYGYSGGVAAGGYAYVR